MTHKPTSLIATALRVLNPPKSPAWHGGPTVMGALRGITAQQAQWRPAPKRKNIWELTLHIAYWQYAVRKRLDSHAIDSFSRSPANWPKLPTVLTEKQWKADVQLLKIQTQLLVQVLEDLHESSLSKPSTTGKYNLADLVMGIAVHDAYHVGQIQLLKKIYKAAMA